MKAIGFNQPIVNLSETSFSTYNLEVPETKEQDLLVEVCATSINPVDYKQRQKRFPENDQPVILGWDAAGTVKGLGSEVKNFSLGDRVYYAGELLRQGSNAEFQVVDHRLVAKMPSNLNFDVAACFPLTTLTAYEALFEKLRIPNVGVGKVLIIGGAGGVGSIAIQLLRALTDAQVYATAGRAESIDWVKTMGAQFVVDRRTDMLAQKTTNQIPEFDYIFSTTNSDSYHKIFPEILKPGGSLCLIDDPKEFDIVPFKLRSQSVHWELMFTKSLFNSERESQGGILHKLTELIENGKVKSTMNTKFEGLSAESFSKAHTLQESGATIGKIAIAY